MARSHERVTSLVVIPARGGSRGIRRKNIVNVAGQPLLGYALSQALAAKLVSRVIVSTDDAAIAEVAGQFGAEIVKRPKAISGGRASSETAVLHALDALRVREGWVPEITVLLQCTAPLTLAGDIDGTIETLLRHRADSAFSVSPSHQFLWRHGRDGSAKPINHKQSVRLMRQDVEPQFAENGAIYAMTTAGFLKARHRFFGKIVMHVMPAERHLEIDEPADLMKAEAMLRRSENADKERFLPKRIAAVILDFDGVFTDNRALLTDTGHEAVVVDRSDGLGIEELRVRGVPIHVLSRETNSVVALRCRKLGIDHIQSIADKREALTQLAAQKAYPLAEVVFVGNDVNDIEAMRAVGCAVCPADAHPAAKSVARMVLRRRGGKGAVRELCDLILAKLDRNDRARG